MGVTIDMIDFMTSRNNFIDSRHALAFFLQSDGLILLSARAAYSFLYRVRSSTLDKIHGFSQ
jgi:hypothetical protein